MKRLFVVALLCLVGWQGYVRYQAKLVSETKPPATAVDAQPASLSSTLPLSPPATASLFKCDGRTHCSQMSSCTEATFFLKNCPGTKMDGNNDGIPCEKQWCK
jgi:hypothetical protein